MTAICIATSREYSTGNADIEALQQALNASDLPTTLTPWQDVAVGCSALVLPLAIWDYSQLFLDYQRFLTLMENSETTMLNNPSIQRWNCEKTYLQALENHGIATVPSLYLDAGFSKKWQEMCDFCGWKDPVLKPVVGQSGQGVRKLHDAQPTIDEYPEGALLQPYLPSIKTAGEMCLIYLDGSYSHAIRRTPNDWRANSAYGVEISAIAAEAEWQQTAEQAVQFVTQQFGETPLYARVDGLLADDGQWQISEVELIEPALYLSHGDGAMQRFIDVLKQRLKK